MGGFVDKHNREMIERAIIIVLDSVGIGQLPDAVRFGDEGCNTLANIARSVGGLCIPNLEHLGIGKIHAIRGVSENVIADAFYGKMLEESAAKDTTAGHWEISGIVTKRPFPTYPKGFPEEVIKKFTQAIGRSILGNKAASGTEIIKELGRKHRETGYPIVYTSADSVFQIAACEDIISVESLYDMCKHAREILRGEHNVGRVIARPFIRNKDEYVPLLIYGKTLENPVSLGVRQSFADVGATVAEILQITDFDTGKSCLKEMSATRE